MTHTPYLKNSFRLENLAPDRLLMVSDHNSALITEPKKIWLLNQIALGDKTMEDLLFAFPEQLSPFEVMGAYISLQKSGYISETKSPFSAQESAYWESLGYEPTVLSEKFQLQTISIESIGNTNEELFKNVCGQTGFKVVNSQAYLRIVLTNDYNNEELSRINQEQIKNKNPWVLIKTSGTEVYSGPAFIPDQTACWECLQHRLDLNQPMHRFYKTFKGSGSPTLPHVEHAAATQLAMNMAVLKLAHWFYDPEKSGLAGKLFTFDTKTMQSHEHVLVKRPQCKACGDGKKQPSFPPPIQLSSSELTVSTLGGYRSVNHETTFEKYKHHVSAITGIIPHLQPYNNIEKAPIHNYSSGRNLALQSTSLFWLNLHLRSGNGGKGKTEIQAKTGAICEAIERYSLMFHGNEYAHTASMEKLEKSIHPNECMNYSETQFTNRDELNKDNTKFYSLIPIPFNTKEKMEWTPVYSLTNNEFKYLPACFCYAQYPAEDETKLYSYPDSNGCAAGNTIEEAILQGFLELVERDAAAIWWYNRIRRPQVDLTTLDNPYLQEVFDYYKTIDRGIYVLDITTDLGIPVFVAISNNLKGEGTDELLYAFGAHHDANIAIERAIIEVNQLLPIVMQENYLTQDKVFLDWLHTATLANHDYLVPQQGKSKNIKKDYPPLCAPTIHASLMYSLEATKKAGLELLVLDLTQPDIGLPVVKVMVPGMRHFWRRTAPGRLYDVPVKMKWLKKANTESQLNPLSIFI